MARMSGDEFIVLLESVDQDGASERSHQIAAALASPYRIGANTVSCDASIGVVTSDAGFATTDEYLRAADSAMYQAKNHSLGVCFFSNKKSTA